jgi:hypothetical protein
MLRNHVQAAIRLNRNRALEIIDCPPLNRIASRVPSKSYLQQISVCNLIREHLLDLDTKIVAAPVSKYRHEKNHTRLPSNKIAPNLRRYGGTIFGCPWLQINGLKKEQWCARMVVRRLR